MTWETDYASRGKISNSDLTTMRGRECTPTKTEVSRSLCVCVFFTFTDNLSVLGQ